jgi:hypothetical protein
MTHKFQSKQHRIILLAGFHKLNQGSGQPKLLPASLALALRSVPKPLFHLINDMASLSALMVGTQQVGEIMTFWPNKEWVKRFNQHKAVVNILNLNEPN